MSSPFFSVVIPTFNRAAKLKTTIESVLAQSFQNFELLVMDDGSRDETEEVVRAIGDSRIRYEWAPNSGGPATPRNRGIESATAPWMSFLDADDIWYPSRLEEVAHAIARHPEAEVFCHDEVLHVVASGAKSLLKHGPYEPDFYRVMLLQGNRVSTSAVTVRTATLRKHGLRFNEAREYVAVEDYDVWLRLARHGCHFFFIPEALGEYVIEDDNISHASDRMRSNEAVLLRDHVFSVQDFEADKDKLWRELQVRLRLEEAREAMGRSHALRGLRMLLGSAAADPVGAMRILMGKIQFRLAKARK